MKINEYKGWKGTRAVMAIVAFISVTLAYVYNGLPATDWLDFMKWILGVYSVSEVGTKVAAKGED